RHTRCYRDWSSDVCSSDLSPTTTAAPARAERYIASTRATLRRPPRPSHSGVVPIRIAVTKSCSTRRWPRMSDTTGDVELGLVLRSEERRVGKGGGGGWEGE